MASFGSFLRCGNVPRFEPAEQRNRCRLYGWVFTRDHSRNRAGATRLGLKLMGGTFVCHDWRSWNRNAQPSFDLYTSRLAAIFLSLTEGELAYGYAPAANIVR